MHPIHWVLPDTDALLDVGCNVGELLSHCHQLYPTIRLAGVEINAVALEEAKRRLPGADLHAIGAEALPFAEASFDCLTCIEVLEHVPSGLRARALAEMRRVLRPGGRLVLRVPHAGMFAWLDPCNLRFRFPMVYHLLVNEGKRDMGYTDESEGVVWHHHFTREELLDLAGDGWKLEKCCTGALLLLPLMDIVSWPLYRLWRTNNLLFRAIERVKVFDMGCDYGRSSYDILLVLRRN